MFFRVFRKQIFLHVCKREKIPRVFRIFENAHVNSTFAVCIESEKCLFMSNISTFQNNFFLHFICIFSVDHVITIVLSASDTIYIILNCMHFYIQNLIFCSCTTIKILSKIDRTIKQFAITNVHFVSN